MDEPEPPNEMNGQPSDYKEEEVPMEIVKDDESCPARLAVKGFDDDGETVIMTIEEAHNYILSKVGTYIRDSNINPLLLLKNKITDLHETVTNKSEEFVRLNRMFDVLYRDQLKFLRHIGYMPRVETQTVGVSVDLPWLPESMPGLIREDLLKSRSDRVFMQPGTAGASAKPAKKESGGPIECIDLTDDGDTPDPPASIPNSASAPTAGSSTRASTSGSSAQAPMSANDSTTAIPAKDTTTATPTNDASTLIPAISIPAPTPTNGTSLPLGATTTAESTGNKNDSRPAQNIPLIPGIIQDLSPHPASLPSVPPNQDKESEIPPKPELKISGDHNGIVLQWDMPPESKNMKISGYEIFGYQEKSNVPPASSLWKKIGNVKQMKLPMSCTLTQFVEGYKYHFAIRALTKDDKVSGHFSKPSSIMFVAPKKNGKY